ncbi:MAG: DUF4190 domain-containing protein [Acidimicrobiales bacterium]
MSDTSQGPGWWLASDGKWYPPQSAAPPPPPGPGGHGQPRPSNGLAVASLTLGIIGAAFGLIPFAFFIAWICGVLALVFGGVGIKRARDGATGKGMAIAGTVLGATAVLLGVLGVAIINDAFDDADRRFEEIEREIEGAG